MDADLLRSKGAEPVKIRPAWAPGFALRMGNGQLCFGIQIPALTQLHDCQRQSQGCPTTVDLA